MITIYGKSGCVYCERAKDYLMLNDIKYEYINIEDDGEALNFIINNGHKTVPQCYENNKCIGGYEDLVKYTKEVK